jgi:hypothetical protein
MTACSSHDGEFDTSTTTHAAAPRRVWTTSVPPGGYSTVSHRELLARNPHDALRQQGWTVAPPAATSVPASESESANAAALLIGHSSMQVEGSSPKPPLPACPQAIDRIRIPVVTGVAKSPRTVVRPAASVSGDGSARRSRRFGSDELRDAACASISQLLDGAPMRDLTARE